MEDKLVFWRLFLKLLDIWSNHSLEPSSLLLKIVLVMPKNPYSRKSLIQESSSLYKNQS